MTVIVLERSKSTSIDSFHIHKSWNSKQCITLFTLIKTSAKKWKGNANGKVLSIYYIIDFSFVWVYYLLCTEWRTSKINVYIGERKAFLFSGSLCVFMTNVWVIVDHVWNNNFDSFYWNFAVIYRHNEENDHIFYFTFGTLKHFGW